MGSVQPLSSTHAEKTRAASRSMAGSSSKGLGQQEAGHKASPAQLKACRMPESGTLMETVRIGDEGGGSVTRAPCRVAQGAPASFLDRLTHCEEPEPAHHAAACFTSRTRRRSRDVFTPRDLSRGIAPASLAGDVARAQSKTCVPPAQGEGLTCEARRATPGQRSRPVPPHTCLASCRPRCLVAILARWAKKKAR